MSGTSTGFCRGAPLSGSEITEICLGGADPCGVLFAVVTPALHLDSTVTILERTADDSSSW